MATVEDVKADFEAYRDDVNAGFASLGAKIDDLTAKIAAGETDQTELQALADEITAEKAAFDAKLNPPAPQPAPEG